MKNWFNKVGIKTKFEVYILSTSIVVITLLLGVIFYFNKQSIQKEAYERVNAESEAIANWYKLSLEQPVYSARDLSYSLQSLKSSANPDRETGLNFCKRILSGNPNYMSVWAVYDAYKFDTKDSLYKDSDHSDDNGRYMPGYYIENGQITVSDEGLDEADSYYSIPKETRNETIIEPELYSYTENEKDATLLTSICIPIIENGEFIGVTGVDISLQTLVDYNKKVKVYETGFGELISHNGTIVAHPNENLILKASPDIKGENEAKIRAAIKNGEIISVEEYSDSLKKDVYKVFTPIKVGTSKDYWSYCIIVPKDEILADGRNTMYKMLFFAFIGIIILSLVIRFLLNKIIKPIKTTTEGLQTIGKGVISDKAKIQIQTEDEIGKMAQAVNRLIDGLQEKSIFAKKIGQGELNAEFNVLSPEDELGNSLLEMKQSLLKAEQDDEIRQEEEKRRTWITEGLAMFGDILRKDNDDVNSLSYNIISNLVKYLKINQGGIFLYNDENASDAHLELTACYAYDRRKFTSKRIEVGEGLIGACFLEKKSIFLTEIPNNYLQITSGLGEENPSCLLLVPLQLNEQIFGVIELASFKILEKFEIEFVERIAESIASTVSSVKINSRTSVLLRQTQEQTEMMRAQEEEMRQNMEEMHATQEEMGRKEVMMQEMIERMKVQEQELQMNIDQMVEKEKYTQDLIETMKQQEEELRQNMEEIHATQEELSRKDVIQQEEIARLNAENQKKIEEVAAKEIQMRGVLETSLDAVIIIDRLGTIEFFNTAAENLWGYRSDELIGKNVKILMGSEHSVNHDNYLNNYLETGTRKVIGKGREVQMVAKDGSRKDIFLSLVETKVDGNSKFTAFIRDLSIQKKNENERNILMEQLIAKEFEYKKQIEDLEKALSDCRNKKEEIQKETPIVSSSQSDNLMNWDDASFSVRIPEIDNQHKKLVDLINSLYNAFRKGQAKDKMEEILNELINYTANHFSLEEKYFEQYNYESSSDHILEHKKLVEAVLAFKADFDAGKVSVSYDLMNFLKDWLINHIQGSDMKYSDCLINGGILNPEKTSEITPSNEENKNLIDWNNDFSVNVLEIDNQHIKLVELINKLYAAFTKGQAKEILGDLLNELISYTSDHFGTEEKYFEQFKYENKDAHILEHQKLVEAVLAFKADFESGKVSVSYDLMNFLKDWLINHIQGSDKKFSDCFIEGGLSAIIPKTAKSKNESEKTLIDWNESLSVNISEIDKQHQKLVELINRLYSAFFKGKAKDIINDILNELIEYTANHFGTEEKYFAQYSYPDSEEHIIEHKNFVESVLSFKADFDSGKVSVSYEIMNFLKDWLINHIQGTDKLYSEHFNNNGLK